MALRSGFPRLDEDARIVVKLMRPPQKGQDIQREVTMLAAVQGHPNVIKFHRLLLLREGGDESWGIVQQWCGDGDLFNEVENGPCSEVRALFVIADVARGLEHIHSRGVVHRDIKADNVFRVGHACVLGDFGSAAYEADRTEMSSTCGTLGYVAPEMLLRQYSSCSYPLDVFSAGVLLYLLLSARLPFGDGRNEKKTCRLSCLAHIKYKAPLFEHVSSACKALLQTMCQRLPLHRPSVNSVSTIVALLIQACNVERSLPFHGDRQGVDGAASASKSVPIAVSAGEVGLSADDSLNKALKDANVFAHAVEPISAQGVEHGNLPPESMSHLAAAVVPAAQCSESTSFAARVSKRRPTPYLVTNSSICATSSQPWSLAVPTGEARAITEPLPVIDHDKD
eukprot:TRINITY_DN6592_c0_g1_i1.p1 TRINITY_DN6592_c0_g1~~TRINITY_DN6592_c0_g1_i1.p1  ORF type:complete len:417 (-),score=35.15 TRINITY_DN6592_c0_g1_i1:200-1387(-)